jgi:hypothetical protein
MCWVLEKGAYKHKSMPAPNITGQEGGRGGGGGMEQGSHIFVFRFLTFWHKSFVRWMLIFYLFTFLALLVFPVHVDYFLSLTHSCLFFLVFRYDFCLLLSVTFMQLKINSFPVISPTF